MRPNLLAVLQRTQPRAMLRFVRPAISISRLLSTRPGGARPPTIVQGSSPASPGVAEMARYRHREVIYTGPQLSMIKSLVWPTLAITLSSPVIALYKFDGILDSPWTLAKLGIAMTLPPLAIWAVTRNYVRHIFQYAVSPKHLVVPPPSSPEQLSIGSAPVADMVLAFEKSQHLFGKKEYLVRVSDLRHHRTKLVPLGVLASQSTREKFRVDPDLFQAHPTLNLVWHQISLQTPGHTDAEATTDSKPKTQ
ncbi:uncharacterized protein BJ171DRAFT_503802 [Polychytrium aggregatum]|uniref:uncharacterized protein n=1 Tax=Polychytrium aggregatum TaxID=110093 RepID=UPI0022FE3A97|nr:uncharacterized protein BJ171DRAFT_503802 [Polychytrium aggregatum]KAI9204832.1 hypothetical protein BJ171DRAFT_503802 [Polychytrium aggregatum]